VHPVDLLVALKLAAAGNASMSVRRLGDELGLSKSSAAYSLQRLRSLRLITDAENAEPRLNKLALRDCLEHASRWIAPATVGAWCRGLSTANASSVVASKLRGDGDAMVIPFKNGPARGRAVSPLHRLAPAAAAADEKLHRLLALVDAFRIGRARDREVAAAELRALL
jgi:hypothetical protein